MYNTDYQVKHHIWWIVKTLGETGDYNEFTNGPLSQEICEEIDALVAHIKLNY